MAQLSTSWLKDCSIGLVVNTNVFNTQYYNNGFVYDCGYSKDEQGNLTAYNELRVFPQAPIHLMGTLSLRF